MGIHESQSLFNEIIIGSNRAFWQNNTRFSKNAQKVLMILLLKISASLKRKKASLIRIDSDSLTYPLHIIIRYEIEKCYLMVL